MSEDRWDRSERRAFYRQWRRFFRFEPKEEPFLMLLEQRIAIDLIDLEKKLRLCHPGESPDASICEMVERHYGAEAVELVRSVL